MKASMIQTKTNTQRYTIYTIQISTHSAHKTVRLYIRRTHITASNISTVRLSEHWVHRLHSTHLVHLQTYYTHSHGFVLSYRI